MLAAASTLHAGIPSSEKGGMPKGGGASPASESLWGWFVGGSGGYLLDNETDMWHGHLGVDLPWQIAGFDTALFLEVGWAQFDYSFDTGGVMESTNLSTLTTPPARGIVTRPPIYSRITAEIDMVPVTLNGKLERNLFGPVNAYLGAGAGIAFFDLDVSDGMTSYSDQDVTFYAQVFAGLLVHLCPSFEVFAGARWIYVDEPEFDIAGTSVDLDGTDFQNDDILLEAGGRLNF